MILPDVNVLIYAFRGDSEHHTISKKWLDTVVADDAQFGLSPLALSAVARITTNPRIFKRPSATAEAFRYCDNLLSQPHCTIVEPGDRHWQIFSKLCVDANTRGPRITDAWFAALAIEQGCTWITFDSDYTRFPGLNWREPQIPA